jgi:hypothetical protein
VIGILWHTPSPNNLNNLKAQEKKKRKMSGRLVVGGLVGNERRGELKGLGVKGMNEFFTLLFDFFFLFLSMIYLFFFQAELTQSLQQLSEKAKSATEVIQRLKSSSERVQVSAGRMRWPSDGAEVNDPS